MIPFYASKDRPVYKKFFLNYNNIAQLTVNLLLQKENMFFGGTERTCTLCLHRLVGGLRLGH